MASQDEASEVTQRREQRAHMTMVSLRVAFELLLDPRILAVLAFIRRREPQSPGKGRERPREELDEIRGARVGGDLDHRTESQELPSIPY